MTESEQRPPESPRPALTSEGEYWFKMAVPTYLQMVNAMGHHINNPLFAINGNVQLLRAELADQKKSSEAGSNAEEDFVFPSLDIIDRGAERIGAVTRKLSNLAAIVRKAEKCQFREGAGQSFVDELESDLEEIPGMEVVKVSSSLSEEEILADTSLLGFAVNQLLQNSLEAGASEIKVKLKIEEDKLKIEVIDNGKGLENTEPLFGLNSSTKVVNSSVQALSLGLFGAKTIVLAHGGEIDVQNREDGQKGVVAKIGLPLVK